MWSEEYTSCTIQFVFVCFFILVTFRSRYNDFNLYTITHFFTCDASGNQNIVLLKILSQNREKLGEKNANF